MRSLWRILASQWLGGESSEALTEDSTILDGLVHGDDKRLTHTFEVRREPQVSRYAMMLPDPKRPFDRDVATEEALRSGWARRYSR